MSLNLKENRKMRSNGFPIQKWNSIEDLLRVSDAKKEETSLTRQQFKSRKKHAVTTYEPASRFMMIMMVTVWWPFQNHAICDYLGALYLGIKKPQRSLGKSMSTHIFLQVPLCSGGRVFFSFYVQIPTRRFYTIFILLSNSQSFHIDLSP